MPNLRQCFHAWPTLHCIGASDKYFTGQSCNCLSMPWPNPVCVITKWVLQMIGQLCVCEHKRFKNGIHRLINVYSKILLCQLYTYAGTQSLQTSNIMVRETNPSLYSLVQRLETPKCIRGAMNSCTIESRIQLTIKASMQAMFSSYTPLLRYNISSGRG